MKTMQHQGIRASWPIVMSLALVSATGCMCMGAGDLIDRMSSSRQSHRGMCGMDHGRPTTQPDDEHAQGHHAEKQARNDAGGVKETER